MDERPGDEEWTAWRPEELARRLQGIGAPWAVVGGWALDLWVGRQTREHGDLEIAVDRRHLAAVRRHLPELRFYSVGGGEFHRLEGDEEPPLTRRQNWAFDPGIHRWCLDVMLESVEEPFWTFRRDPTIRAPREAMFSKSADGIPHIMPVGVLLFKAKGTREKDEADFETVLPRMDADAKAWLREALEKAHPGHAWIARLRE